MQFVIPWLTVRVPRFSPRVRPFLQRVAREAIENSYGSNLQGQPRMFILNGCIEEMDTVGRCEKNNTRSCFFFPFLFF